MHQKFHNKLGRHGGKVFLAHLYIYSIDNHIRYLENLIRSGLIDGVEVYYSCFNMTQIKELEKFCKKHKILMSAGTDCHGERKPNIKLGIGKGNMNISESIIKNWL